jgi:hypothetical protein
LVHGVLELLPRLKGEIFNVDIHDIRDFRHLDFSVVVPLGVPKSVLTQKCAPCAKHTASRTSWLHTRKESRDVPVNFP